MGLTKVSLNDIVHSYADLFARNAIDVGKLTLPVAFIRGSRTGNSSSTSVSTTSQYRITTAEPVILDEDTTFTIGDGFRARLYWFNKTTGDYAGFGSWETGSVTITDDYAYHVNIARSEETEDNTEVADIALFSQQVYNVYVPPVSDILMSFVKGYGTNITTSNAQAICGGDADNLPSNQIYAVGADALTYHAPSTYSQGYTLICLSSSETRANGTGAVQIAVYSSGRMYCRQRWNSVWSDWAEFDNLEIDDRFNTIETGLNAFVKGYGTNITSSNAQTICGKDADNLPSNQIYAVAASAITSHVPSSFVQGYTLICLSSSESRANGTGAVQIALYSGGHLFYRTRWNSAWSAWEEIGGVNSERVLAFGDSICLGARNGNLGFAGDLGLQYKNDALDGGCISTVRDTTTHWFEYAVQNESDIDFDAVMVEGGINDYIYSAPLGTLPTKPTRYDDADYSNLDTSTIIGALEHLFGLLIHKFTKSTKYFLITHKTRNYPWTTHFTGGYTQEELHDAIVAVCDLYNIIVIDVYKDSNINTFFPEYYSPTNYVDDNSVGDLYYVDHDQVHPLNFGYVNGYAPIIKNALRKANHKI